MLQYAKLAPLVYSDMNGVGPYLPGIVWNGVWWFGIAILLGVAAYLTWIRGSQPPGRCGARSREGAGLRRSGRWSLSRWWWWGVAGGVLFRNANTFNRYRSSAERQRRQVGYERTCRPLDRLPEPRMIYADVRADLEPERSSVWRERHLHLRQQSCGARRLHPGDPGQA